MEEEIEVLLELIEDVLDKPKKVYESKQQYGYDCPNCMDIKGLDKGDNKSNLEINLNKFIFHCWGCGISGPLGRIFDDYGTKEQKKVYNLIKPEELKVQEAKKTQLKLPEGYTQFKDSNPRFIPHAEAYRYLTSRGITDEIIEKYQIGYTVTGEFAYRVIVPSFNKNDKLNYFIARSWVPNKMKYKNPTAAKDEIIFNENRIDWFKDVYLVEGAFDGFFLDNSIAMLGKKMSTLLFETLYENALGKIIICLDEDAWVDALNLYHTLNGGRLYNKIKIIKPPKDMDVADLRGQIDEYYFEIL
jgi:DNA primase